MRALAYGLALVALVAGRAGARDLESAKRALHAQDDEQRRAAVRELAALGGAEAWELVLGALEDEEARVADEAQLALGGAPDDVEALLLGKPGLGAKRELTAQRVAEALGRRASAPAADAWKKALRAKDAAQRRLLLWSVERLAPRLDAPARAALAPVVAEAAHKDKDERVRAHAWVALGALDAAAAHAELATLARDGAPAVRAACAELCGADDLALAGALAADGDRLVRLRAYEALARRRDAAGARALAAALGDEAETRPAWRLVELLQDLSGRKEGRNARGWQAWAAGLADDWTPGAAPGARAYDERTVAFVGLPLLSTRLAFVIDLSGSMWAEREGGTRKQRTDVELRRALEGLGEEARFNLVPFTREPVLWQKQLTAADPRAVKKALEWFEGRRDQGPGNYWDAMLAALEDPDVDTLVVLGDGAPSGGTRWNLELLAPLFGHENRFRGVCVDVLLVDAKGRLRRWWEQLAAASGGRALTVEL